MLIEYYIHENRRKGDDISYYKWIDKKEGFVQFKSKQTLMPSTLTFEEFISHKFKLISPDSLSNLLDKEEVLKNE